MVDIIIQGICGRMGHTLDSLIAERDDCRIVAGVDAANCGGHGYPVYPTLAEVKEKADVLIDFSLPAATRAALAECAKRGLPSIICTTGLTADDKALMAETAKSAAVFYSANMSLGVNVIKELACRAQAILKGFDIEIVEKHHHNKLDAPSGTALALADAINEQAGNRYHYVYDRHSVSAKRDADEIGILAVRGGSIVGEHDVIFAGPEEVVTLSHAAQSRTVFAHGAIAAALFVAGKKPGMYSMDELVATI